MCFSFLCRYLSLFWQDYNSESSFNAIKNRIISSMTHHDREYLARLPDELLLLIAEDPCLSTRDIGAFALASSRYANVAHPVLYENNIREENASACKTFRINSRTTRFPLPSLRHLTLKPTQ